MAESTSRTSPSHAALLFYAVGVLLLLAFAVDLIQDDGSDWTVLGGAAASFTAGVVYQRKHRSGQGERAA